MPAGVTPGGSGRTDGRALRVVIIGGGIAGLACVRRLTDLARERDLPVDITLLEAAPRLGGVITTERSDGFLIEGGPDCFISEKPWAVDLCRRLGLEDDIIGTNPDKRRSFVLRGRRVLPIPEGYQLMAPGRLLPFATSRILSLGGKLRAAADLLIPRGPELADQSLAAFVRRRFGREVLERLAQPLVGGIYNADPESLSLRATMPRFLEMERRHRSIILALLKGRRRGASRSGVSGARYSLFVTLRHGLQSLVDRLSTDLTPGAVRLGTPATAVGTAGDAAGRYRVTLQSGDRLPADAVVLALPAHLSAPMLRALDRGLADRLASIPYGTSVTVSLGYRDADIPRPLDGFGIVVPRMEGLRIIACSVSSMKFAGRAPAGSTLLRCFLGGPSTENADPQSLERDVRRELETIMGIRAEPILARTHIWARAMAQYRVGHLDTVAAIETDLARHPGLALAGNGLWGVGIPDCVHSGENAAENIAALAGAPA